VVSGVGILKDLLDAVQVHDSTFARVPSWGPPPPTEQRSVSAVHTYPGIAFIRKAAAPA
jgi:hypothetical protein